MAHDDVVGRLHRGPADAMDWVFRYAGPNPAATEVMRSIGAVLAGEATTLSRRNGHRAEARKIYGGAWTGPVFVLTHQTPDTLDDPTITVFPGVRAAVATALRAANERNVLVTGANVAQQCIPEGLVDEVLVHVAPLLLGDGVRLYGRPGSAPVDLETTSITQSGQLTNLRFQIIK